MKAGEEISITIDQTLTQDATGTMAYLEFEAMGIPKVKTKLSVSYVDHNTLQAGFENADDHRFLKSIASKYGLYFSRPGNGICHQLHMERFAVPGETLLGSDSHTPNAGSVGMLAIGAGGLSVALAMAGEPFFLVMPQVVRINLKGTFGPGVSAKDVILEVLRRLTVKGGVGKIIEYGGKGIANLTVPERAAITNMGAELGATTSVFPSDEQTLAFLKAQGREKDWMELKPDSEDEYDEIIEIDLDVLEPLIATPSSPDNVVKVKEIAGEPIGQVCIGSCANSSYMDLMSAANILKGNRVHPDVSLTISPGSRQALQMITENGALADIIASGARLLECTCGPCIGMGQSPATDTITLRTFTRNFPGRSGTVNDRSYLCSPLTAAVSAIIGKITDPADILKEPIVVKLPENYLIDDSMILPPSDEPDKVEIIRGPNIKPFPVKGPLEDSLKAKVILKVGDNITTDDIMPAGAKILPLRSNVPAISEYVFSKVDADFPARAKASGGGIVLGGLNYGQGSSREHAALAPMYLGVKVVLAKSFARIHKDNLINFGILPLTVGEDIYDSISQDAEIEFPNLSKEVRELSKVTCEVARIGIFRVEHGLTERQKEMILAGGLLNYIKEK
ncbi:MAG TPA: aconitate hydratase [Nitrospirae bacterium]|nr:aconitate hydratase [Nitrospirota bacterium]HDN94880.1 aconitate hydratase [Nitrospirota bacterium]HDZ83597.1 aconitate hydratase [Nitrospirota bacterium]